VRNLALLIVPAVAMGAIALLLQGGGDSRLATGAIAVAMAPAPLVALDLVGRMRGRADLAGALVLGSVTISLLVIGSRGALAAGALFTATEAYALSAMFGNALPTIRDALLLPLRLVGWFGFVLVLATFTPFVLPIDATTIGVAAALLVAGAGSAAVVARAFARDPIAAIAGAGLRDPALAAALATVIGGPESSGIPIVYAVFCLGLAALALRRR
jgi:hypothetical protein